MDALKRSRIGWLIALAGLALLVVAGHGQAGLGETESRYHTEEIPAETIDTSDWTELDLGESALETLEIPAAPFFDDEVTRATVSSNGFVALGPYDGPAEKRQWSGPIPKIDEINGIIAPAWNDLDPECGSVRYQITDDVVRVAYERVAQDENRLACEIPVLGEQGERVTAWTELNTNNGTIEIHVLRDDGTSITTTGVESPIGDVGNQTRRTREPLREPSAWRFELRRPGPPPEPTGGALDQDDASTGSDAGETFDTLVSVDSDTWTGTLDPDFDDGEDWYQVDASQGQVLTANVTPEAGFAVEASLVSPDGTLLAAASAKPGELATVSAKANSSKAHVVRIVPTEARGNYTVQLDRLAADRADELHEPHAFVGVPDTALNPYHEVYYRPNLTAHPCTYVPGYPCDIPALPLSVEIDNYEEAAEADEDLWNRVEPGQWYWIPRTNLIAVSCESDSDPCIFDEFSSHGTETTSSVISENPDVLIGFNEGGPDHRPFLEKRLPVDIFSVSWGHSTPRPYPGGTCSEIGGHKTHGGTPLYVVSAGNAPWPAPSDCWAGNPSIVTVGGAYARPMSEESKAAKQPDVVSYYCRPAADFRSTHEMTRACGTSFAAPTVAGALSKVVLEVRQESGYTGTFTDRLVDPIHDVSLLDLREALNRTATYDPDPRYESRPADPIPVNPVAPWLQWGWGFYDGWVANATTEHLLDQPAPEKSEQAQAYMTTKHTVERTLYSEREVS